ncbi:MAG TPA: hypothetical protein VFF27_13175 [Bacteroidia bacterium]|jgi:hypothetical protein|nr:hypothetical protein [Bacteroidia bacterium]
MKTKQFLMRSVVAVAFAAFVMTGCKKKSDDVTPDTTEEKAVNTNNAADQSNVDQQSNESMDDVNSVLNNNMDTRDYQLPCNITVDSAALKNQGLIKITYHGLSCDGLRKREGVISIQLPFANGKFTRWNEKGAKVIVTYNNYKVTRVADNKSITFNGSITMTNVNGGGVLVLLSGQPIIHSVRGGMVITFDDGTTREWVVARKRSYVLSVLGVLTVTEAGDTTLNGVPKTAYWGKNRAGDQFSVSVPTEVVTNVFGGMPCRLYKPVPGVVVITANSKQLTITYGVDSNGTPVTGALDCPYGYKLNWTDANGAAQQLVVKY